jgi:hypothetical protein
MRVAAMLLVCLLSACGEGVPEDSLAVGDALGMESITADQAIAG